MCSVVGSVSCHPPKDDIGGWPDDPDVEAAAYREQAELLRDGGVDAIFVEMLTEKERALRCVGECLTVGLPVFCGLVCSRYDDNTDPTLQGGADFDEEGWTSCIGDTDTTTEEVVQSMLALPGAPAGIAGFNIHHTKIYATGLACRAVRSAVAICIKTDEFCIKHDFWIKND